MSDAAPKKTPLYEEHVRLGAKMIPFGDWIMPVQYSSIMDEHQAVRNNVGVFDISHMGQLVATGPTAGGWLNEMLTNNIDKLEVGSGQYTFLLNEKRRDHRRPDRLSNGAGRISAGGERVAHRRRFRVAEEDILRTERRPAKSQRGLRRTGDPGAARRRTFSSVSRQRGRASGAQPNHRRSTTTA